MRTIQINTCTQEDLEWLPGVGPKTAQKIVEARPVGDIKELETLLPPSAWLKIQGAEVEFAFGADGEEASEPAPPAPPVMAIEAVALEPIVTLLEPEPLTLRRVMPGQELKSGAEYLCIWNMHWGPDGAAWTPADAPAQTEIEAWFNNHDMGVQFAHYGASIQLYTRNRGLIPLVLFEIIKETENAEKDPERDRQGNGQGD